MSPPCFGGDAGQLLLGHQDSHAHGGLFITLAMARDGTSHCRCCDGAGVRGHKENKVSRGLALSQASSSVPSTSRLSCRTCPVVHPERASPGHQWPH